MPVVPLQQYEPPGSALDRLEQMITLCTDQSKEALRSGDVSIATLWHNLGIETQRMLFACNVVRRSPKPAVTP